MLTPILIIGAHVWNLEKNIPTARGERFNIITSMNMSYIVIYVEFDIKKIIKNRFGKQDFEFKSLKDLKQKNVNIPNEYLEIIKEYI